MNVRYRVELSEAGHDQLTTLLSGGRHAAPRLKRAQILLAADAGASDEEIAISVAVGGSTVYWTKRRFVEGNLEAALSEEPRPGTARKLSGTDLLNLISDILDLSKIESGTVSVVVEEVFFADLQDAVVRPFRHDAENRRLSFDVQIDPNLDRSMTTDSKRLQRVLKNLLSNALKFTAHGGVRLSIAAASGGWSADHPTLKLAPTVVAFGVSDAGIGIAPEKQKIIFEAFQQADAGTSRKYGGTGLGLAISRALAALLGGEIRLRSTPGIGSIFTLYLPLKYVGLAKPYRQSELARMPAMVLEKNPSPNVVPISSAKRA